MKRSKFIQSLGLGAGGLILPKAYLSTKPILIYDNYVRGLEFYNFRKLRQEIKEGDPIFLIREEDNMHDSFATAIYYADYKLGYIPAYENIVIANMLDAGAELNTNVSSVDLETGLQYALAIQVFAELVIPTDKLVKVWKEDKRADDAPDLYREY
tara:strand:+ start:46865 stop:47329 length:465 start_codon:yes stop_codon:yes gene_type:complete